MYRYWQQYVYVYTYIYIYILQDSLFLKYCKPTVLWLSFSLSLSFAVGGGSGGGEGCYANAHSYALRRFAKWCKRWSYAVSYASRLFALAAFRQVV